MEGVTDPCFRDLVLALNPPEHLGGAFTEFARVVQGPIPARILSEHLGQKRFPQPVGLQLMGSDIGALEESARRAAAVGAPIVDLNFGCPARGALRGCAGSALLREPRRIEEIVRATVSAVDGERRSSSACVVTAKIRAGFDDASRVEELARAVEAGGASMLTVHCRTRAEAYCAEVDWERIARAVRAVSIPVCGNGGIGSRADFERMRNETGCRFVMVGRAALADPWIFSGARVDASEAARFLVEYAERLIATGGAGLRGAAGRVKQLLGYWTAGDLVHNGDRASWLRESEPERLLGRLYAAAAGADALSRAG